MSDTQEQVDGQMTFDLGLPEAPGPRYFEQFLASPVSAADETLVFRCPACWNTTADITYHPAGRPDITTPGCWKRWMTQPHFQSAGAVPLYDLPEHHDLTCTVCGHRWMGRTAHAGD